MLEQDAETIREGEFRNFNKEIPKPYEGVKPFVGVNLGDEVRVRFRHSLNRNLSIHVQGLAYEVNSSDGANVGFNLDSTTTREKYYTWYAQGVYLFIDMGDTRSSEEGTNIHGLIGAIIVEAPMAQWFDPVTGDEIEIGLFADIYHPSQPAFREYAVFFHDELEMKDKDGNQPIDHHTGLPSATTGISYREPMRERLHEKDDPAYIFSSYVHGDPATPLFKAYAGDRVVFRTMMPADKLRNTGHTVHGHMWREQPLDPFSRVIPLQGGISIGNKFDMELEEGAACPGDYLYRSGSLKWDVESGMWGILRVLKQGVRCKCKNFCHRVATCFDRQ